MNPVSQSATPALPLRDLQLPEAISWWPLAPGWWILSAIIILTLVAAIILIRKHWRENQVKRETRSLLQGAFTQWQNDGNDHAYFLQINQILKRYCRHYFPAASGLSGQAWIDFLNHSGGKQLFSGKCAQALSEFVYRPAASDFSCDQQALLSCCLGWLKSATANRQQEQH